MKPQRWLIYALGGGCGHLIRSLALARAAARRGHRVRVLTNSPFAARLRPANALVALASSIEITELPPAMTPDQARADLPGLLERAAPDVFIVDAFPRGLAGELVSCNVPAPWIWVHRDLQPAYLSRFAIREFAEQRYALILAPGERGPASDLPQAQPTQPWLLLDANELRDRQSARAVLRCDGSRPCLLVSATGKRQEWARWAAIADALRRRHPAADVRLACLDQLTCRTAKTPTLSAWPLLPLLPDVDLLIGAAGYNTVYEARATATPLLAVPQQRRYDRQRQRVAGVEEVTEHALPLRVTEKLAAGPIGRRSAPEFENGTHQAVRWIEALT